MRVGIGLPHNLPEVTLSTLLAWAEQAERRGFSSLATTDRLVYCGWDSLLTLTAAAAVTSRIGLTTAILLSPLHANTALLAKQTATLDRMSGGRLTLGVAVGVRMDDYMASGVDHARRGRILDEQLDELRRLWSGERRGIAGGVGPAPARPQGPEIVIGGHGRKAVERAVRSGAGWMAGGGGPRMFAEGSRLLDRLSGESAGSLPRPRRLALGYFCLGPDAEAGADTFVSDYYGFLGPVATAIRGGVLTSAEAVRGATRAYQGLGCDELLLMPCLSSVDQLDRLAGHLDAELLVPAADAPYVR